MNTKYISLDFGSLRKLTVSELWLSLTQDNLYGTAKEIKTKFLEVLPTISEGPFPESVMETKRYIDTLLPVSSEIRAPYLHLVHYWATMSKVSSHEIMYNGESHDIELTGAAKFLVEQVAGLSSAHRTELLDYLTSKRDVITNPIYTMYMRSAELASPRLESVAQFWISVTSERHFLRRARGDFHYDTVNPHEEIKNNVHYLTTNSSLWWIPLIICPGFDISLDFFVMQDYSRWATLDGAPLMEEQKEILSAFLMASEKAQRHALAMVMYFDCF